MVLSRKTTNIFAKFLLLFVTCSTHQSSFAKPRNAISSDLNAQVRLKRLNRISGTVIKTLTLKNETSRQVGGLFSPWHEEYNFLKISDQFFAIATWNLTALHDEGIDADKFFVFAKKDNTWKEIGEFPTRNKLRFPLNVSLHPIQNSKHHYLDLQSNDNRNTTHRRFILDVDQKNMVEIEGYEDLGSIEVIDKARGILYGYQSCGCADACWNSKLVQLKESKLEVLGTLKCDCENPKLNVEGRVWKDFSKSPLTYSCAEMNIENKFVNIKKIWQSLLTN